LYPLRDAAFRGTSGAVTASHGTTLSRALS
jgi:hypothetical protein